MSMLCMLLEFELSVVGMRPLLLLHSHATLRSIFHVRVRRWQWQAPALTAAHVLLGTRRPSFGALAIFRRFCDTCALARTGTTISCTSPASTSLYTFPPLDFRPSTARGVCWNRQTRTLTPRSNRRASSDTWISTLSASSPTRPAAVAAGAVALATACASRTAGASAFTSTVVTRAARRPTQNTRATAVINARLTRESVSLLKLLGWTGEPLLELCARA
jgi:hypothetical protein